MAGSIKFEKYKKLGKTVFFAANEDTSADGEFAIGKDNNEFNHKPMYDGEDTVAIEDTVVRAVEFYKDYSSSIEYMNSTANEIYLDEINGETDAELLAKGYDIKITEPSSKPSYIIDRDYDGTIIESSVTKSEDVVFKGKVLDNSGIVVVKAVLVTEHETKLI